MSRLAEPGVSSGAGPRRAVSIIAPPSTDRDAGVRLVKRRRRDAEAAGGKQCAADSAGRSVEWRLSLTDGKGVLLFASPLPPPGVAPCRVDRQPVTRR